MLSRRAFLAALPFVCSGGDSAVRLRARPDKDVASVLKSGLSSLELRRKRDALVYNPASAPEAAPFVLYLHGATGNEEQGIHRLSDLADEFGFVLLSPASENGTWDAIRSGYGSDMRHIDQAMSKVFAQRSINPHKMAVCGFSDGASLALGVGISNGDLFRNVIAFSPGFIPAGSQQNGSPRIFISHGTQDRILPIDICGRRLANELKQGGYSVKFREFDGPHAMPPEIAREALTWFLK